MRRLEHDDMKYGASGSLPKSTMASEAHLSFHHRNHPIAVSTDADTALRAQSTSASELCLDA